MSKAIVVAISFFSTMLFLGQVAGHRNSPKPEQGAEELKHLALRTTMGASHEHRTLVLVKLLGDAAEKKLSLNELARRDWFCPDWVRKEEKFLFRSRSLNAKNERAYVAKFEIEICPPFIPRDKDLWITVSIGYTHLEDKKIASSLAASGRLPPSLSIEGVSLEEGVCTEDVKSALRTINNNFLRHDFGIE